MLNSKPIKLEGTHYRILGFKFNPTEDSFLYLKNENNTTIRVKFIEAIQFSFNNSDTLSEIHELREVTGYFKEALSREYVKQPFPLDEYREYHLYTNEGRIFLKIVCQSLDISLSQP